MTDTTSLQNALLMIRKLKKLLQDQQEKAFDPVAIIGMSCRVPQANNYQEFWTLLNHGKDVITPILEERWDLLKGTKEIAGRDNNLAYHGGYLSNIAAFDAYFFGISPREAVRMDPQQRMLLEVAWESFEDAGLTVDALAGSNTGVFSSLYGSQYGHFQSLESDADALFIPTGSAVSIAANRLSYLFDLHGPSMTLDTACSSSLIATQLACLNLQAKLCDQAIVNAVNINLLPSVHSILSKATMLSPTGKCHTFDASADGYVQGEGVCSIVLKPLSRALRDKDQIHAVIAGGAINQDGKTNGLTAPSGKQQEALLRKAYRSANIDPALVSYVECHGTGTLLGDPIELQALGEVIGKQRDPEQPCWISSVKTNLGHLEPAAGLVGLIKVALMLKNGVIPEHLHFTQPNPHIDFDRYHLKIPQHSESLPRYGDVRVAGISGFGFGGANAHLVLRELSCEEKATQQPLVSTGEELFTISAKDANALQDLIARWCDYLQQNPELNLPQLCYNLHLKRTHYAHRLSIVARSTHDLYQKLKSGDVFISQGNKKNQTFPAINNFDSMDLPTLAKHYINQATIDWKAFEAPRSYPTIDLPLYPWQHKRYWPTLDQTRSVPTNSVYPLSGKALSSPLSARQFEFIANNIALPEMIDTFYVLHAGYYLEMVLFAMRHLHKTTLFTIQNLTYTSPIVVPPNKTVYLQLIMEGPDETPSFTVYSHDGQNHWIDHATGKLLLDISASPSIKPGMEQCQQHGIAGTGEAFYERILSMGMPAGNTVRWIDRYWTNHRNIFCELRAQQPSDRCSAFTMNMHPGIIDACIQTLFLLLPPEINHPYVTSNMGDLTYYGKSGQEKYIYAVIHEVEAQGQTISGDWYLLDEHHQIIAACTNIRLAQLNNRLSISTVMDIQSRFELDLTLPREVCKQHIEQHLTQQFALIFSMPVADLRIEQSLLESGMDSLMALAVIRMIETSFNVTFSLPALMQDVSIQDIADFILKDKLPATNPVIPAVKTHADFTWISYRKPQKNVPFRLFCFPFGGGGASIYREWQHAFPDTIEVCPIQLPGRENRMDETPIGDLDTLIALLAQNLEPLLNIPFAFFGHSMGSLIAFELSRYLRKHHLPEPVHLFPSAYPDPRQPSKSLENLLQKLSEKNINLFDLNSSVISELSTKQLGILSSVFKENGLVDYGDERMNQTIINVLLPIFISDMSLVKGYQYRNEQPLALPITAFVGQQDTWVAPEDMQGWAHHSSVGCEFQRFESGHLFIREEEVRAGVIRTIVRELMLCSEAVV